MPASNGGGGDVGEAEAAELILRAPLAPPCPRPRRLGQLLALFRRCGLPLAARARSDGRHLAVERSGGLRLDVLRGGDDLLVAVKWLSEVLSLLMFVSWSGSLASSSLCSVVASSVAGVLRSLRLVVEGVRVRVGHEVRDVRQHRHHNSKRAPSLFTEGEMLLNLGITTNIYRFTTFWSSQAPNLFQAVAISEARG